MITRPRTRQALGCESVWVVGVLRDPTRCGIRAIVGLFILTLVASLFMPGMPARAAALTGGWNDFMSQAIERTALSPSVVPASAWAVIHAGESAGALATTSDGSGGADADTPFLLGSLSKPLTAAGIMLLVDRGELDLDDTVREHISEFRPQDADPITIEQLLTHTSGFDAAAGLDAIRDPSLSIRDRAQLASHAVRGEHVFAYSNLNYAILGALIEEVSGGSFAVFMERELFSPLDMHSTSADTTRAQQVAAGGRRLLYGFPVSAPEVVPHGGAPDGFTVSTSNDMAAFMRMLLRGGIADDNTRLLSATAASAMLAEQVPTGSEGAAAPGTHGYGYGWGTGGNPDRPTAAHVGRTGGFFSHAFLSPRHEAGVIVLQAANGPFYEQTAPVVSFETVLDGAAGAAATAAVATDADATVSGEPGAVTALIFAAFGAVAIGSVGLVSWLRRRRDRRNPPATPQATRRRRIVRVVSDVCGAVAVVLLWQVTASAMLTGSPGVDVDPLALSTELTLTAWGVGAVLLARAVLARDPRPNATQEQQ